jgi:hypothetical protein
MLIGEHLKRSVVDGIASVVSSCFGDDARYSK